MTKTQRLGEYVKVRRQELGLSQEELAKAAGLKAGPNLVYMIEAGLRGRVPSATTILGLARALDVEPGILVGMIGRRNDGRRKRKR